MLKLHAEVVFGGPCKRPGRVTYHRLGLLEGRGFLDLSEARSRLYQSRFLQVNTHFEGFFEIYKIISTSLQTFFIFEDFCTIYSKFSRFFVNFRRRTLKFAKFRQNLTDLFQNFAKFSGF